MNKVFTHLIYSYFFIFQSLSSIAPTFTYASHISSSPESFDEENFSYTPRTTPRIKHELEKVNVPVVIYDESFGDEPQHMKPVKAGKNCWDFAEELPALISYALFFFSLIGNIVAIVLNIYEYPLPATATMAIASGLEAAATQFKVHDDRVKKTYLQKQKKKAKTRKLSVQEMIKSKNAAHTIALQDHQRLKTKKQTEIGTLQAKQHRKITRTKARLLTTEKDLNTLLIKQAALHLSLQNVAENLAKPDNNPESLKRDLDLIMHHYLQPNREALPLHFSSATGPSTLTKTSKEED